MSECHHRFTMRGKNPEYAQKYARIATIVVHYHRSLSPLASWQTLLAYATGDTHRIPRTKQRCACHCTVVLHSRPAGPCPWAVPFHGIPYPACGSFDGEGGGRAADSAADVQTRTHDKCSFGCHDNNDMS